ncbi:methyl-accepting chemotaxis protein [Paenibacillus sp. DMB5]|uniref:methyl-accepting chemotaxis protein n=1 Tax=Paenibacillus sp. DMB5 TaxID=1780103 RepID=UPI00076CEFF8|nr:methyl-accepting chemotaxis protein [Paenibacillus sp. DMB5]KUP22551.1 chemotaxis protein [Paenibacillus sp. DMB5]
MRKIFQFNSIRKRILFGFSLVMFFVIILGVYNFLAIKALNTNMDEVVKKQLPRLILDEKIVLNMSERTSLVRGYILYGDPDLKNEFDSFTNDSIQLENELSELSDSEKVKELLEKKVLWGETINKVFEEYDSGNKQRSMEILVSEVRPLEREILDGFKELSSTRQTSISDLANYVESYGKSSLLVDIIISILIVVIGISIAMITAKMLSKPIISVMNRMKAIADGDFSQESLIINSKDEIGHLALATNEMTNNTKKLLNQINTVSETVLSHSEELTQAANEVTVGTGQIAVTMEELALGAETQANSTSDLSTYMDIFINKVNEAYGEGEHIQVNSEKVLNLTNRGSQLMKSSTSQMENINIIVKESMEKMQELDTQSQEISKLVLFVEEIAEQTNLLALNAAIEAARAGEKGNGFAVVANQFRKLAEQVALSVNDITLLVTKIKSDSSIVVKSLRNGYDEVEQGTTQINTTGETFNEINSEVIEMVESILVVSQYLLEISKSSKEMNGFIADIASVSEEAAAGVEQTAASAQQVSFSTKEVSGSSDQLAKLSEELRELVRRFRL